MSVLSQMSTVAISTANDHHWMWNSGPDLFWCARCGNVEAEKDLRTGPLCVTPPAALTMTRAELKEMRFFYDKHFGMRPSLWEKDSHDLILVSGRPIRVWGSGEIESPLGRSRDYLLSIKHHQIPEPTP